MVQRKGSWSPLFLLIESSLRESRKLLKLCDRLDRRCSRVPIAFLEACPRISLLDLSLSVVGDGFSVDAVVLMVLAENEDSLEVFLDAIVVVVAVVLVRLCALDCCLE